MTNSQSGLKSVILRYFSPVGADESYLIGESPKETHNLFLRSQSFDGSQEYIEVCKNDYPTKTVLVLETLFTSLILQLVI